MSLLWTDESGRVTRFEPRSARTTRYAMKQENFCETCGAEFDGPAPKPRERVTWRVRLGWLCLGGAVVASWWWALEGVVF